MQTIDRFTELTAAGESEVDEMLELMLDNLQRNLAVDGLKFKPAYAASLAMFREALIRQLRKAPTMKQARRDAADRARRERWSRDRAGAGFAASTDG